MDFLTVKNWEELQHYKDRTPPWIKLYNHLLDDFEFACLPDASKAHLLSIWLLASRTGNKIPNDQRWISNKINATEPVDLKLLISAGFLIDESNKNNEIHNAEHDASKMLQSPEQNACLEREERREERETEEEKEKKKTVSQKLDFSLWPSMPNEQLFKDWKSLRARLKANVTQTVIDKTGKELHKAVKLGFTVEDCFETWVYKGWRGFEADWMVGTAKQKSLHDLSNMQYESGDL